MVWVGYILWNWVLSANRLALSGFEEAGRDRPAKFLLKIPL